MKSGYQHIIENHDSKKRNSNIPSPGIIKPWIQDFTASWVEGYIEYGPKEIKAQIKALEDNGIEEYMLWNPYNSYDKDALR